MLLLASALGLCLADTVVSDTITAPAPAPKTLYSPAPASSYGAPSYKPSYKPSYNAPTQTVQTVGGRFAFQEPTSRASTNTDRRLVSGLAWLDSSTVQVELPPYDYYRHENHHYYHAGPPRVYKVQSRISTVTIRAANEGPHKQRRFVIME